MRERPILFNAEMVQAILNGNKTQTRRFVRLPCKRVTKTYGDVDIGEVRYYSPPSGRSQMGWADPGVNYHTYDKTDGRMIGNHIDPCPYGQVGDQLWVREVFGIADSWIHESETDPARTIAYRADLSAINYDPYYKCDTSDWGWSRMKWKPSIFMPRWASRIQLEITNIRVERLNDISEKDAKAEGVERCENIINGKSQGIRYQDYKLKNDDVCEWFTSPINSFETLWESINGEGSWDVNPWVWVVEFKRLKP